MNTSIAPFFDSTSANVVQDQADRKTFIRNAATEILCANLVRYGLNISYDFKRAWELAEELWNSKPEDV
jgi:hypothetical protein